MCKYCYTDSCSGVESGTQFILHTEPEKVFEGKPSVWTYLRRNSQDVWELVTQNEKDKMAIKIKYCPFCGRDLDQWEYEYDLSMKEKGEKVKTVHSTDAKGDYVQIL